SPGADPSDRAGARQRHAHRGRQRPAQWPGRPVREVHRRRRPVPRRRRSARLVPTGGRHPDPAAQRGVAGYRYWRIAVSFLKFGSRPTTGGGAVSLDAWLVSAVQPDPARHAAPRPANWDRTPLAAELVYDTAISGMKTGIRA